MITLMLPLCENLAAQDLSTTPPLSLTLNLKVLDIVLEKG